MERMDAYAERNGILRSLGFGSYAEYLKSPMWRGIRERVMARSRWKCRKCGCRAKQVHHVRYTWSNLSGKSLWCLMALCRKCHKKVEFKDGKKVVPWTQRPAQDPILGNAL
jgi:5-methylcytosine-specific restriction endonuclease McrA